ncbi:MAG TPA: glycosyltransferase family 39 protein, partial [Anaerolineales bacterium]|nr:glycosyltransferase family 39 protein [Anaerolineales bacterium]
PERQRWMTPAEYFDTATSTLNPNNRGAGFYVYGNLPLTLVRVTYEMVGADADPLKYFGRQFSALADLLTIFILYFIVARLYNRKTALLAAAFSALAVMQIQQSHYFTVDLFMNPFMYAALYFAVRIAYDGEGLQVHKDTGTLIDTYARDEASPNPQRATPNSQRASLLRDPFFWNSIFFGLFLGMAAACKINAVVLAVMLPIALVIRFRSQLSVTSDQPGDKQDAIRKTQLLAPNSQLISRVFICLVAGGIATLLAFRIFQPYAFDGLLLNEQWLKSMSEIRAQATGLADLPWNLQWVRRTHLYSFTNLTVWGLGLPLGILAWTGFLFMGWRILKGERQHLLLWLWTALYFGWQSLQFNATMRYQLPIYPLLAMMAAWVVFGVERLTFNVKRKNQPSTFNLQPLAFAIGGIVLVLTAFWAFAFLSVYTRPETRVSASRWIYQNVPGPVTLHYTDGTSQPLSIPVGTSIITGSPYLTAFTAATDGALTKILLSHVLANPASPQTLSLSLLDQADATSALLSSFASSDFSAVDDPRGQAFVFAFDRPVPLTKGQTYFLRFESTGAVTLAGATIANETDYDWTLPFRIDGYDAFGGMYGDLNLQVYWDDNADKLARFQDILNQTDYIFIPTNHQYAQIPRVPERYPLTTVYYRELIGCPPGENILWCYRVA